MEKKNIQDILNNVDKDGYTAEEEQIAKLWLFQLNQNKELHLSDQKLDEVSDKMWLAIEGSKQFKSKKPSLQRLWPLMVAAAIVVVLLGGLLYDNLQGTKEDGKPAVQLANDIKPGKIGATLTLANGKMIRLSDASNGVLASEAGVVVSKTIDGQLVYEIKEVKDGSNTINTLSTEKGETYLLILPDKSKVWLNAASRLTYSTRLNEGGMRKVRLEGEAFFEVKEDKTRPFIVKTANQEIEVLGTEFNVNSYQDEAAIATTLVKGSVKVKSENFQRVIKPGEQLVNDGAVFKVKEVNLDQIIDWKEGEFNLDGLPFRTAMRKIARWYNVELVYDSSVPDTMITGGWISRDTKLLTILEVIEKSKQVSFKLEGKKLYISK